MAINILPAHAQVPFKNESAATEKSENDAALAESNLLEFKPGHLAETDDLGIGESESNERQNAWDTGADFAVDEVSMVKGTYSVHEERCLSTPDFYESAYSRKQPWQQKQTNFGIQLASYGHFRSFFSIKGNYKNFFDMFEFSKAPSFYQENQTPSFYSDEGNCTETSFYITKRGAEYKTYKPFAAEPRGYTRSYFSGVT